MRPVVLPWSGDPVADYVARCEKGMTNRQIGWIIEDFRNAGLDQLHSTDNATDEELDIYLSAQQRWYQQALVDGLRLTREQSAQVAKKLGELFKNAEMDLREKPVIGDMSASVATRFKTAIPAPWRFNAYGILPASEMSMSPWNLCQLSASQERLTWMSWFELLDSADSSDLVTRMENASRQFRAKKGEPLFWSPDPLSANLRDQTIPNWVAETNSILPLHASQKILSPPELQDPFAEPVDDGGILLLANIRLLHPAQFKLVLLFGPELAEEIQSALENSVR